MKKLLLVPMLLLFIISCSHDNIIKEEATVISENDTFLLAKGPPCGKGKQLPCSPNPLPIDTLVYNSNSAIDIVFIADGFLESEMQTYYDARDDAMSGFLSYEPMASNINLFNFYDFSHPSPNSGIWTNIQLEEPTLEDAYYQQWPLTNYFCYKNKIGMPRYIGMGKWSRTLLEIGLIGSGNLYWDNDLETTVEGGHFKASHKAEGAKHSVFVICIVNDPMYGGGAEFVNNPISWSEQYGGIPRTFSVAIISLDTEDQGAYFEELVVHETAHSIWDLDDEYIDNVYATNAPLYEPDFWNYPNRLNTKDTNPGGWFEGSRYVSTGKWRSSSTSMMRNVTQPFSALQQQLIQDRIDDETGN